MNRIEKAAIVYGVSVVGAAAISFLRGKRELSDIGMDALLHGGLLGTGANVVLWLYDENQQTVTPVVAVDNSSKEVPGGYGKITAEGISWLSQINPDVLYKAARIGEMLVGPAPQDPNIVVLPE